MNTSPASTPNAVGTDTLAAGPSRTRLGIPGVPSRSASRFCLAAAESAVPLSTLENWPAGSRGVTDDDAVDDDAPGCVCAPAAGVAVDGFASEKVPLADPGWSAAPAPDVTADGLGPPGVSADGSPDSPAGLPSR